MKIFLIVSVLAFGTLAFASANEPATIGIGPGYLNCVKTTTGNACQIVGDNPAAVHLELMPDNSSQDLTGATTMTEEFDPYLLKYEVEVKKQLSVTPNRYLIAVFVDIYDKSTSQRVGGSLMGTIATPSLSGLNDIMMNGEGISTGAGTSVKPTIELRGWN